MSQDIKDWIDRRGAMIFDEWAKRYSENPEGFGPILDSDGNPTESYGYRCAVYFRKLADEMDATGLLPTHKSN